MKSKKGLQTRKSKHHLISWTKGSTSQNKTGKWGQYHGETGNDDSLRLYWKWNINVEHFQRRGYMFPSEKGGEVHVWGCSSKLTTNEANTGYLVRPCLQIKEKNREGDRGAVGGRTWVIVLLWDKQSWKRARIPPTWCGEADVHTARGITGTSHGAGLGTIKS